MKTKLLFLTLFFLITVAGFSQNNWMWLYGQVTNDQTNAGEPNHLVHFMVNDSMGGYIYDSAYTDNNGYYNDTLYINSITQGSVQFSTADPCTGNMIYAYQYFSPPFPQDMMQDFLICEQAPPQGCENYFTYSSSGQYTFDFNGFFPDTSLMFPYYWEWTFGDGTTASGQNVSHTFPTGDSTTYTVCLTTFTFVNNDSCYFSSCQDVYIGGGMPCEAFYTAEELSGVPLTWEFTNLSTGVPNIWCAWNFGDGTFSYVQDPVHTFAQAGTYEVCLEIIDSLNNCQDQYCEYIVVNGGATGSCIAGYVYLDSMMYVDEAYVHLLILDSLNGNLMPIETTTIDSNGFYLFDNVVSGNGYVYYTQAVLSTNSIYYGQYLPTYHYNAINWNNAGTALPGGCPVNIYYDISMQDANAANAGSGTINGTVYGNTKDVVADIEMLLFNENMEAIKYVYTDASGNYEFDLLDWGTYYVYPEMVGLQSTGFMVVLSEDNPSQVINITIQNGVALSVNENSLVFISGELYPNPAKSTLSFTIEAEYSLNATLSVYSIIGQEMIIQQKHLSNGTNNIDLNVSTLPESIYYLRIQVGESKPLMRKFIKVD